MTRTVRNWTRPSAKKTLERVPKASGDSLEPARWVSDMDIAQPSTSDPQGHFDQCAQCSLWRKADIWLRWAEWMVLPHSGHLKAANAFILARQGEARCSAFSAIQSVCQILVEAVYSISPYRMTFWSAPRIVTSRASHPPLTHFPLSQWKCASKENLPAWILENWKAPSSSHSVSTAPGALIDCDRCCSV